MIEGLAKPGSMTLIEKTDWQPIETAPKDGDRILGCWWEKSRYHFGREIKFDYDFEVEIIHWSKRIFNTSNNTHHSGWIFEGREPWECKPEYWMPLPGPPRTPETPIKVIR